MSALSIRLPDDLKDKAMRLAKKKKMSFNGLVNYWLQAAVTQDVKSEDSSVMISSRPSKESRTHCEQNPCEGLKPSQG